MKTHWLLLVLLGLCGAAHADRAIVYSARYYTPPGSHRTSHFHIYRINPDGTGKTQLTFGTGSETDETDPKWSPDSRSISFAASSEKSTVWQICTMNADGHNQRVLRTLGESETLPAPPTPGYKLENIDPTTNTDTDKHILVILKTGRRLLLTVPEHDSEDDMLLPSPGSGLVYAANNHNSTNDTDYLFYRLNAATGELRYLTEGQFLAWSPDGTRFCTAPCRDTTPYEKRKPPFAVDPGDPPEYRSNAEYRKVWFAPLYVRAASGGKMRQLTPMLSDVDGADWRKVK